ncbi:MAG: DUF3794 domain-containing protein [Bacillota bacterium]
MELENGSMYLIQKGKKESSQILLEGDAIVPENKPDVFQVLHCHGEIIEKSVETRENQFTFTGELLLDILYTSATGAHGIYAMKSTLPIEETIYYDGIDIKKEGDMQVLYELEHLSCEMANDRKLALRGIIDLTYWYESVKELPQKPPKELEDMEFLEVDVPMKLCVTKRREPFQIKEVLVLKESLPAIGEVLRLRGRFIDKDVRATDGKAIINSTFLLEVLYRDDMGIYHVWQEKIPFYGTIDDRKLTADAIAQLQFETPKIKGDPKIDDNGEARRLDIEIDFFADFVAWHVDKVTCLSDAYAPLKKIEMTKEVLTYPKWIDSGENLFQLREKITVEEGNPPMMQVESTWGEIKIESMEIGKDVVEVTGILESEILYVSAEDESPISMIMQVIPFTQKIEMKDIEKDDDLRVESFIEDIDFQIFSEREGELVASILLTIFAERELTEELIVDMAEIELEDETKEKMAGAIIYMVRPGDTLWNIAKTHDTTVDDILKMNPDIESPDVLEVGQKLLLMY